AEERVIRDLDAVERQPRLVLAQPERRLAAQHVDVMPARREVLAQLGRDDPASSYRGVANDPDVHNDLNRLARGTGSRTMNPSAHRTPARAPNCASRLSMSCRNNGVFRRVAALPGPGG